MLNASVADAEEWVTQDDYGQLQNKVGVKRCDRWSGPRVTDHRNMHVLLDYRGRFIYQKDSAHYILPYIFGQKRNFQCKGHCKAIRSSPRQYNPMRGYTSHTPPSLCARELVRGRMRERL